VRLPARYWHCACTDEARWPYFKEDEPMLSTVLIVVLVLALIGALPTWPYSAGWGYYPSGGLGIIVLVVLVLLLTGRL
jgi:hypothetical protein